MEFNQLINEAKELKCSKRLIDNLEISGEMEDAIALEEDMEKAKAYFLKEQERNSLATFYNSLVIFASENAVKEVMSK